MAADQAHKQGLRETGEGEVKSLDKFFCRLGLPRYGIPYLYIVKPCSIGQARCSAKKSMAFPFLRERFFILPIFYQLDTHKNKEGGKHG